MTQRPAAPVGEWNEDEIRVEGQIYTVKLDGHTVCVFDNTGLYPQRGLPSAPNRHSFIGLQVYATPASLVAFRRIRIRAI